MQVAQGVGSRNFFMSKTMLYKNEGKVYKIRILSLHV